MEEFSIQGTTTAEKDKYLIDCFYDAGFLKTLIKEDYSILAGRKGSGKTAIAKFLENKYGDYSLLGSLRIPIESFTIEHSEKGSGQTKEKIVLFILLKTAKYLFDKNLLIVDNKAYWEEVFEKIGFNSASNYEGFETVSKRSSIGVSLAGWIKGKTEKTREKKTLEVNSNSVFSAIRDSLETLDDNTKYLIFVDDVSDYLDESKRENVGKDINIIKDILFKLDSFNTELRDTQKGLRFIVCIRDELFEFMEGSNINKLKTNSLFLSWDERSFAGLLVRRLPHFRADIDKALGNPIEAIREFFPDEIFRKRVKLFNTKRYATNFYAYMVAISFNRPRDFLAFCYTLRDRLSFKYKVTIDNIDSAEIEYTDYFVSEMRDELFLASKIFKFKANSEDIDKLIDILGQKEGFSSSQFRTEISMILDEKTSVGRKKIERFIYELWWYGVLGFKEKKESYINFRYIPLTARFVIKKAKTYIYYLHRGLWWHVQKRKKEETKKYG